MSNVAFLGTGLLGSGLIESMLRRGEQVTVWNRTMTKAQALEQFGATVAATAADAIAGADRIHMILSDDAVVDAVLGELLPALPKGALVIDHTTTSPEGTKARYARMEAAGIDFLHAPVFMSPDMARNSLGLLMTSGPETIVERAQPALRPMSGDMWYLGHDPSRAAAYKLFGNSMLFVITAGLADVFAMARNQGITAADAISVFSKFQAGGVINYRGQKMAKSDFAATFELTMARKDIRLMIESAGNQPMVVLPTIARAMDDAIASGHGHEDLGAIARPVLS
jgi:3-hydroxyisobutyrate dehydrogenase-like beta-hydroxyacid dehydrogenase